MTRRRRSATIGSVHIDVVSLLVLLAAAFGLGMALGIGVQKDRSRNEWLAHPAIQKFLAEQKDLDRSRT